MELKQLRMDMMKSKKSNPERAKVLQAILGAAQLIAKEDKNRDVTEQDIVDAAKQEAKMANQSKSTGAPYNEMTFTVTAEFLPKQMTADELNVAIGDIVAALVASGAEKTPKIMGQVMGQLTKEYAGLYDGKSASGLVKAALV